MRLPIALRRRLLATQAEAEADEDAMAVTDTGAAPQEELNPVTFVEMLVAAVDDGPCLPENEELVGQLQDAREDPRAFFVQRLLAVCVAEL